eukprot:1155545-Pelagomonas_calceolata.AAC.9
MGTTAKKRGSICLNEQNGCDGGSVVIHLKAVGPWTQKLGRIAEQQQQHEQQKQQQQQQQQQQQTCPGCHVIDVIKSEEACLAIHHSQSLLPLKPTFHHTPRLQQHWPALLGGPQHLQGFSSSSTLPELASSQPCPPPVFPSIKTQLGDQSDQLSLVPMEIEGPYGDCLACLGEGSQVIVLVAGGLGITPMAAIQRELILQQQQQQREVHLKGATLGQRLHEEELDCSTYNIRYSETSPLTASMRTPKTSSFPSPPQIHMAHVVTGQDLTCSTWQTLAPQHSTDSRTLRSHSEDPN